MVKTITISDDVYKELLRIKGDKSFSELFRELLRERKGNADALRHIFGILKEEEYKEAKKRIKELEEAFDEWGQSLIRT
ncbi:antitoxin VapB family protein [Thermococcus sp.]